MDSIQEYCSNKENNDYYIWMLHYLHKDSSPEAEEMLKYMKDLKTNNDFLELKYGLEAKLLLDAFKNSAKTN